MSFLRRLFGSGTTRETASDPAATGDPERVRAVEAVLAELRPLFRSDGGDIVLLAVEEDGWVVLRTRGACHGCSVSSLTLQGAITPRLRERCEWFRGVRTE